MATITWTMKAAKQLARLPKKDQIAVSARVDGLAMWPECRHVKALAGRDDYRLRVGRYRVVFTIRKDAEPIVVRVEEVKKRDERTY